MRRPGFAGFPKQECHTEIKQRENEADDKRSEEEVPEENNFIAVHAAIIYFSEPQMASPS
jgi:hypothetical protein